ncbi:MarR family transcriptional regulator [Candidatus Nanopelagicales bacterium]|nr:MarR family transcriptional regulator [Candidatus Nanopelagicales bacterium]
MADPIFIDTWRHLLRYHRTTMAVMDQHLRATFGRSLDDYDVLHQLSVHDGPMRMGELAEQLLVANSSCNRIVGRLEKDELIERSHGDSDGRVVFANLAPKGKKLRRRMAAVHTRDIEALFGSRLTTTQSSELGAILQRLLTTDTGNDVKD